MEKRRFEPTGLAKPGKPHGLTGMGPGLAHQEAAGWVFGRYWNRIEQCFRSKPGPLVGVPDPLLTLDGAMTIEINLRLVLRLFHLSFGHTGFLVSLWMAIFRLRWYSFPAHSRRVLRRLLWESLYLFVCLFHLFLSVFLAPRCIARGGVLHDWSLSSVARDESRMARDESRMARDESRMARDEPCMTRDYCRPEESIHRCVSTHSQSYSYIYGLVALLDYVQSNVSTITI
jgi:hypothetical protein